MTASQIIDCKNQAHMLGLLVRDTTLLAKYRLTSKDLIDYTYFTGKKDAWGTPEKETIKYLDVFKHIENKYLCGKQKLDEGDIPSQYHDMVHKWAERAHIENIEYYYNSLRKTTVIREAYERGIHLDAYIWHVNNNASVHAAFDKISLEDLINEATNPIGELVIEQNYGIGKSTWDSNCGTPESYLREFLNTPAWGVTTMSPLLNTIIHGWCPNTFYEIIASSGAGKSMMSYSSMAYGYMKSFYENGKWFEMENNQSCLYVGTEMDINTQIIPQIACSGDN